MKLKIVYISLFLALLSASSCKKQLEKIPTDGIQASQAFLTDADFNSAVLGMYFEMTHSDQYLAGDDEPIAWISTLDLLADNLISQQTGRGSQRSTGNWQYNAQSASSMFQQGYKIIRSANGIIENIKNIDSTAKRNDYYGEALAVRAMIHFDLLRVYSKPISGPNAAPGSLGITYTESTDIYATPNRGTVQETYDHIVADLNKSLDYIAGNNGVGRLNKAVVNGLLSRVYLYGGEWQKCVDVSAACLAVSSDPGAISVFSGIWKDATNAGVLFKIRVTAQDRTGGQPIKIGVGYSQTTASGIKSEWVCSYSLSQLYHANDVRTNAYIVKATYGSVSYNAIAKYLGRDNGDPKGMLDIKYLRVAEILLNQAEAYTMIGDDANAVAALDALRSKRYTDFEAGTETGQNLKNAIALERRLELAFEGDRWFDLKRKGLPVERDSFGDRADGTGKPYFVTELPADDYHWQYPIPQSVIQANTNLIQNPGF